MHARMGNLIASKICNEIQNERARQKSVEGWTDEHDDEHSCGELRFAAISYCVADGGVYLPDEVPLSWPFGQDYWKPTTYRRNLIKAAALIVAEIERIDRISQDNVL